MTLQKLTFLFLLLLAAFVLYRVSRRKSAPAIPTDPDEMMPVLAARAVAFAAERGVNLDFSPDSVRRVEVLLSDLHRDRAAGKLADRDVNLQALRYGAYVGEVIRRAHGGHWTRDHPVAGPRSYPLHVKDSQCFPIGWCGKRILNGEEDNVWTKYQFVTTQDHPAGGRP